MRAGRIKVGMVLIAAVVLGAGTMATADGDGTVPLSGYEEVPAVSTVGAGEFQMAVNKAGDEIRYRLSYAGLEADATQSHIHFGTEHTNGSVVVFLCTNLGNGPAGTPACPLRAGTLTGTVTAANVGGGAAGQGIAAGEFAELLRAVRAGATYVNVHTTARPGGEIRAQLGGKHRHGKGGDDD